MTAGDALSILASLALGVAGWAFGRFVVSAGRRRALALQLHQAAQRHLDATTPHREIPVSPDWAELVALHGWQHRRAWELAFKSYRSACSTRELDAHGQRYYSDAAAVRQSLHRLQDLAGVKEL